MSNLFIFRRDLRVIDNLGLHESLKDNKTIPIFIFSKKQVLNNKYFSDNSFSFLIESLGSLEKNIKKKNGKLYLFFGDEKKIISQILKDNEINNIYTNKQYVIVWPRDHSRYQHTTIWLVLPLQFRALIRGLQQLIPHYAPATNMRRDHHVFQQSALHLLKHED